MLEEEIISAVQSKLFSIWVVDHIEQGMEILSGIVAGSKDEYGEFSQGSVHYLVNEKMKSFSKRKAIPAPTPISQESSALRRRRRRRGN
jgi:hypothetical protein